MTEPSIQPLTAETFAPFGQVIEQPEGFGRAYFGESLASTRSTAKPSLSLTRSKPLAGNVLIATRMERHEFSSQSFVPIDVSRYLVMVAPHNAAGLPDTSNLKAFLARGDQGITYAMNVWHHPLTVLDQPARFAIFMWLEGGSGDEEFVDLPAPVTLTFPTL